MKVLGICAGRHGGNSETLLKEALRQMRLMATGLLGRLLTVLS